MANEITTQKNEVAQKSQFRTSLTKQTDTYTNMMITQFKDINIQLDTYQKVCLSNAIAKINELLYNNGLSFNDPRVNQSNLTSVLAQISMLKLNAAATPRECYFQLRNDTSSKEKKDGGYKLIEFGVEGNGNDAILRTYGVGVKNVYTPIIIREGDEFTYPYYDGEKFQPFTWKPKSYYKKPIAVVYIIEKEDGSKEYLVSEREKCVANLQAHINNNLMTCFDTKLKNSILTKIENMTLDEILADAELTQPIQCGLDNYGKPKFINCISPAWKSPQSRNAMLERKMRNNAIKGYPKDYAKAYTGIELVEKAIDDSIDYIDAEVNVALQQTKAIEFIEEEQAKQEAKIKPTIDIPKQEEKTPAQQPQQQEFSFDEYNV